MCHPGFETQQKQHANSKKQSKNLQKQAKIIDKSSEMFFNFSWHKFWGGIWAKFDHCVVKKQLTEVEKKWCEKVRPKNCVFCADLVSPVVFLLFRVIILFSNLLWLGLLWLVFGTAGYGCLLVFSLPLERLVRLVLKRWACFGMVALASTTAWFCSRYRVRCAWNGFIASTTAWFCFPTC